MTPIEQELRQALREAAGKLDRAAGALREIGGYRGLASLLDRCASRALQALEDDARSGAGAREW
jgi:hypothetical protein